MYGSINMQSATRAIKRKAVLFVFVKQAQLSSVCKSGGQEHKAAFKHKKKNQNLVLDGHWTPATSWLCASVCNMTNGGG